MRWRDLTDIRDAGAWLGLDFEVAPGEVPARPGFRVEYASPRTIRVSCGGRPLLWGHVESGWQRYWTLAADLDAPHALRPITAADLRDLDGASPFTPPWWSAWTKWFARTLVSAPQSPLHPGRWWLRTGVWVGVPRPPIPASPSHTWWGALRLTGLDDALSRSTPAWDRWTGKVLRTRPRAADDSARVDAWRKRARDGTLPPILLLVITEIDACVIVDGHARLQAALLERARVPVLVLAHVRTQPGVTYPAYQQEVLRRIAKNPTLTVAQTNAMVIDAWDESEQTAPRTRAWPIVGGRVAWRAEVVARLAQLGLPPDHAMVGAAPGG